MISRTYSTKLPARFRADLSDHKISLFPCDDLVRTTNLRASRYERIASRHGRHSPLPCLLKIAKKSSS